MMHFPVINWTSPMKTSPSLMSLTSLKLDSLSNKTNLTLILKGAEYDKP
jgi:hypothetical protein